MSHTLKARTAGAACLCLLGASIWGLWPDDGHAPARKDAAMKPDAEPDRFQGKSATGTSPLLRIAPQEGAGSGFIVAMDEVCVRRPDGTETFSRLDPPASPGTLSARLAALAGQGEILPIAYPVDQERTEATRRIITRDVRVQIEGDADALAAAEGLKVTSRPDYAPGWVIMSALDPLTALGAAESLRASAGVASADVLLAMKRFRKTLPNDALIGQQWHLKKTASSATGTDINVENAWKYGLSGGVKGAGIRIGIIDDGLQTAHPDLITNVDTANGWDWNGNDADPNPVLYNDDHGTACAGVAGARGNNSLGVSGVAPEATLVGMRLISASTTDAQEAEAMSWKNDIISVKSNSWGPSDNGLTLQAPGPLTLAAFANATTNGRGGRGIIFTWAAGNGKSTNDNSNYDGYANLLHTIAVTAIDSTGASSNYAEPGANILISAPSSGNGGALGITTTDRVGSDGYNISSSNDGDYTSTFGGTSSATPVISGVAALMLKKNPNLGWRDVQEILIRTASQIQPADSDWKTNAAGFKFNHKFGAGLVNATAAVDMAATWTNLQPQTSLAVTDNTSVSIPENNATGAAKGFNFTTGGFRVERATVALSASHSARGELDVTLTSPSGMVSQLAQVHSDTAPNYSSWTFSSTHHWGENAQGTWILKVADRSSGTNLSGGTLGAVTVKLYGAAANPPPQVQITSPASGVGFSPGATVNVQVSASDLAIGNVPGAVSQVELFVDDVSAGVDAIAPYSFSISPANGAHTLVAKATDNEGAQASSAPVTITMANQPPTVTAVTLSATGQGYSDTPLSVSGITAADPEGAALTYSYQWQSSTDQITFTNAAGATGAALPASASNAGKLWRCNVRASDGLASSAVFASPVVNLLTRPAAFTKKGSAYQYTSGLVIRGVQTVITRQAIINEFSQGQAGGSSEWVEILTLQSGSLVSWQLSKPGYTLTFNNTALWSNVPAGTLIVIYRGSSPDARIPVASDLDVSDGRLILPSTNTTYFTGAWPILPNDGSSLAIGNGSTAAHTISYGIDTTGIPTLGAVGDGKAASFSGGTDAGANLAEQWKISTAGSTGNSGAGVSPGAANGGDNQTFVTKLRINDLSEIPPFRLGSGSDLPAGLSLNTTTGEITGTVSASATMGSHTVIIERYNGYNEVTSQTFNIPVYAANYAQWIGGFSISSTSATADPDADGVPNLVEYMTAGDPHLSSPVPAITSGSDPDSISIIYLQSKVPSDATLVPEWSLTLDASGIWQTSGITTTILEEDGITKRMKASLPVSPGDAKRFLRLRASTP